MGDEPALPAGDRVSHFRLLHPLGAGGMGEVYAAIDETLGRRVALKAVRPDQRLNAESKTRFLREARILSQLDHPNICRVHDYFEADGRDWLVLELIEGRSLNLLPPAALSAAAKLQIAEQIAAVLVVTHAAGVVHRDLKPANVMITAAGQAKVLDFGLAHSTGLPEPAFAPVDAAATPAPAPSDRDLDETRAGFSRFQTQHGTVSGTLAYMSPEQAAGEPATSASDMYAFGLVLQELLTGRRPYDASLNAAGLLEQARNGTRPPVEGVPADLAALVRRLQSAAPSQRPTAIEALDRLRWIHATPKRRLRRFAIAAAVAIAALGGAKYTVDLARERTAAVAARENADRRRQQAETLIGFMLGNLRTKLQQTGRLELLEDVGREAMAYFNAVPPSEMSGEELFRRSQASYQIGQIRQAEGQLAEATIAYRESLTIAVQVAARDPNHAAWQLGLGTAHFYLGEALRAQGDLAGAMREYSAYRDVAQRLVDREPANERWALELSYGHGAVAAIQEAQGDLEGARTALELALQVKQQQAARAPDDLERQQAVANGHNRLGQVLDKQGKTDEALRHFLADLEIGRALTLAAPNDLSRRQRLQVAISAVGRAYEDRGDLAKAIEYFRAWHEEAAAYAAVDRHNADWQRDLGAASARLADGLRLSGDLAGAQRFYAEAVTLLQPLARASPPLSPRQRDLAIAEFGAGAAARTLGDTREAAIHAASVERLTAPLVARGQDRESLALAVDGRLLAADAAERDGDRTGAARLREHALTLLEGAPTALDKRTMAVKARALMALHRRDEANALIDRLLTLGYHHPALPRPSAR
jgi:eukaryotic-like serine/threonine-protein kinase